jgi:hypothetical protein
VTWATFVQGPYAKSRRYRDFMGWEQLWYAAEGSLDALLGNRRHNMMHLISYLRQGDRVFETWWTTRRGVEAMDNIPAPRPDALRPTGGLGGVASRLAAGGLGARLPARRPAPRPVTRVQAGHSDRLDGDGCR